LVKFLSPEWVDTAKSIVLKELDPVKDLKGATTSFLLVVTNIPPDGTIMSLYFSVTNGELKEMLRETRDLASEKKAEFIVTGNYDTFVQIVKGNMSIVGALLKNRVQFKGNTVKALSFAQPIERINDCLRKINTEF
jgi:putative sterol carrier protein